MPVVINSSYQLAFGKLSIRRGTGIILDEDDEPTGKVKLYSWDVLPFCTNTDCAASRHCPYVDAARVPERCLVIGKYLKHTVDVIFGNIGEKMTEAQLFRVGTTIIPLYRNLARMKIEEVGLASPVNVNMKGSVSVSALYREIREHIKLIDSLWRSIGIEQLDMKFNMPQAALDFNDPSNNTSYYDKLEEEVASDTFEVTENKVKRKLKLRKSVFNQAPLQNN